jgi:UDP-N-acetylmuramate: L-alanyl-gamma-D-glutamyl-meso-diaminopimelate ligase
LFSKHALEMKKMPMLSEDEIAENFGNSTQAFSNKEALYNWIKNHYSGNENLLLMSSGTFDGMSLEF